MSDEEFEEELKLSGFGKYYNMLEGTFEDEPSEHNFKFNVQYPSQLTIDNSVQLEVHHKYYIWNKLPWEYDKDALTTLCVSCHKDEHFGKRRIVYTDDTLTRKKILQSCLRCNGSGYLSEYNHVQNGICFACGGYGGVIEGTEKNSFKI